MADRIDAVMATAIALDVSPAERSLRNLKNSVDIVNRAVQNNAETLSQAGEGYKSAKAKAEGLSDVIEKQREVVNRLAQQQADQIDIAKNQQQNIADLTEKIKQANAQRREEAEANGRSSESYKQLTEKVKQYQKALRDTKNIDRSLNSTNRQLESARNKLLRYTREQQEANREVNNLKPIGWNRVGNAIDRVNHIMDSTKDRAGRMKGVFMGTFAGNALSNAASTAWGHVKMAVGGAVAMGYKFNEQQQSMLASWTTLAGSASKGQDMVDMTNKMAVAAQNSTEMVDKLNQKFYAVTNSKDKTEDLSNAVLKLQDAFNVSDDAIENFGTQWSQMVGNGKASAQDMLSIQNVFPKFHEELLKYEQQVTHNKDLTMKQMNDLMSKGKISSDAMNTVLISMGQEYQKATDNFAKTLPGMTRTIKAMMPRLLGDATKPLTDAASPVYKAVSKWVSDPATGDKFTELGQKVQSSMQMVMSSFGATNQVNTTKILNDAIEGIGNTVQRVAAWVSRNANTIKAGFNLIKAAGHLAFVALGQTIKIVIGLLNGFTGGTKKSGKGSQSMAKQMNNLAKNMNTLANHTSKVRGIMKGLLALWAAGKVVKFAFGVLKLVKAIRDYEVISKIATAAQWAFNVALDANPIGITIMAVAGLIAALVAFANWVNGHKTLVNDWFKEQFAREARWGKAFKNFFTKTLPNGIKSGAEFVKDAAKAVVDAIEWPFKKMFSWLKNSAKKAGNKIMDGLKGAGKKLSGVPGAMFASGTSSTQEDQIALVNDAQSQHFRELMLWNGGLYQFPNKRNMHAFIPAGAEIIDGETAHRMMNGKDENHFASGTSGSSQLGSWINGLNDYGNGNRGAVSEKFLVELTKRFNEQLAKFQEQIRKANQQAQETIAKAQQNLMKRLAEARQRLNDSLAKTAQRLAERRQRAQQSLAERQAKAKQTYNQKIAKAQDREGANEDKASDAYDARFAKAEATWDKNKEKYKDDPKMLAKAQARFKKALQKAAQIFNNSSSKHSLSYAKTYAKAQEAYKKSISSAQSSYNNSMNAAAASATKSRQSANASYSNSYNSAETSAHTAIQKAQQLQARKVNLANENIRRLKAWRQSNIDQLRSGMAEFANGGIADRPSIFGEAGLEAAIPLDSMKQGNAWQTLAKVVSYYAGNTDSDNQSSNSSNTDSQAVAVLSNKFDMMINLMEQFVSGQSDQIKATKGIKGYDSNRAFNDFSSNFRTAQAGNLTY
ncbi:hypothetical protein CP358_01175 [Lactobacillus sp. UMNPBX7]|nr:hypothetical protein CP364_01300 [Lactobacillus sp. UMNPBX13]PEH01414.1 hypothetical protein CP358_01175 [Lactobacillus sp. UMNPBX7]